MKPPRFQFGLKMLFAVMTNIAIVAGGWPFWTCDKLATAIGMTFQVSFLGLLAIWLWCCLDHITVGPRDKKFDP